MRVGAAQRELARDKGARFLLPGYSYVNHKKREPADSVTPSCPSAPTSGTRANIIFGDSAKIPCTLQLLDSTYFAVWTTPDRSSSRSPLLGTIRLLEPFVARGVYKRIKEAPSCVALCATSTSPTELN